MDIKTDFPTNLRLDLSLTDSIFVFFFFYYFYYIFFFFFFFKVVRFSKFLADVRRPTWPSRILYFVRRFGRLTGFLNNLWCGFNKRCCVGGGKFEEIREV